MLGRPASPGVLVEVIIISEEICSQDDSNHKLHWPLHSSMHEKSMHLCFPFLLVSNFNLIASPHPSTFLLLHCFADELIFLLWEV